MTIQRFAIGLVAVALFVGCMAAHAANFKEGAVAYNRNDYAIALRIFKQLAEQVVASAHTNLGLMYGSGNGVIQAYARAHMWWNISASLGDKDARENLEIVENMMSPTQIEATQKLARECVKKNYKGC